MRRPLTARAGFTLAEVAVTLLIVSIGLVLVLQGLTSAKLSAAQTHHRKVARQLALLTLGQVEAGLFWEELEGRDGGDVMTGTYAEEGYEEFHYELVLGDESFREDERRYDQEQGYHDSWQYERERQDRADDDGDDEDEQVAEPFQKVRIKVGYPQLGERPSSLVLERWMPWELVYGAEDDSGEAPAEESP